MSGPGHATPLHGRAKARRDGASRDGDARTEARIWTSPASGGRPLDADLRRTMEERFRADFSAVRIHDDAAANGAAEALSAKAYTFGKNIYFAQDRFAPQTTDGRRLLGHELAHVVQQSRGGAAPTLDPDSSLEQSAHRAADAAVAGSAPVSVEGSSGVGVARDKDDEKKKNEQEVADAIKDWNGLDKEDAAELSKSAQEKKPGEAGKIKPAIKPSDGPPNDKLQPAVVDPSKLPTDASTPQAQADRITSGQARDRRASKAAQNQKNDERVAAGQKPSKNRSKADKAYDAKRKALDAGGHPDLPKGRKQADLDAHLAAIQSQPKLNTPEANDANLKSLYGTTLAQRGFDNSVGVSQYDNVQAEYEKNKAALDADPTSQAKVEEYNKAASEREKLVKAKKDPQRVGELDARLKELQPTKDLQTARDSAFRKLAVSSTAHPDGSGAGKSPGAMGGRGDNTYVAIQIVDADGTILASTTAQNGGKKGVDANGKPEYFHAEENAIKDLHLQLKGGKYPNARVVVVGDQVVCTDVCRPALEKFAKQYDFQSVDGHTFHEKGGTPEKPKSAKTLAQKATTDGAPTSANRDDPYGHLERQDVSIYKKEGPSAGGDHAPAPKPPTETPPPASHANPDQTAHAKPDSTAKPPEAAPPKAPPPKAPDKPAVNAEPQPKAPPIDEHAPPAKPASDVESAPKTPPTGEHETGPGKKPAPGGKPPTSSPGEKADAIAGGVGQAANLGAAMLRAYDAYQANKDKGFLQAASAATKTYQENTDIVQGAVAGYNAKRKAGQDPIEAALTTGGESIAGFIVPGNGVDQGINGVSNLLDATDDHASKGDANSAQRQGKANYRTFGDLVAGVTPSKMFSNTIGAGVRAHYLLIKSSVTGDQKGIDRFGDDATKGDLGVVIQPFAMGADFAGNLGSGEGAGKALDKTLNKGKGSTIEKTGSAGGDAFFQLGQSKDAKAGKYGSVIQGLAGLSSLGTDYIQDKPLDEALNNAAAPGKGGMLETAGNAMGDAAYYTVQKGKQVINEDIPKAKAALKEKAAELKTGATDTYAEIKDTANEYKAKAADTYNSARDTVSEYKEKAADRYSEAKKRLKGAFRW